MRLQDIEALVEAAAGLVDKDKTIRHFVVHPEVYAQMSRVSQQTGRAVVAGLGVAVYATAYLPTDKVVAVMLSGGVAVYDASEFLALFQSDGGGRE